MAPSFPSPSPSQFIETALYNTNAHYALSYIYHDLKWVIRDHLLSLLREFPSLSVNVDAFFHNDGAMARLFMVTGSLPVHSNILFYVPLTIWLHQCYPFNKPLVFVSSSPSSPILSNHPFIDPMGGMVSPYLERWQFPDSNLVDMVRNLVSIFRHHPAFFNLSSYNCGKFSIASKREAMDILVGKLHQDIANSQSEVGREMEKYGYWQKALKRRGASASKLVSDLEVERSRLKKVVDEKHGKAYMLQNWVMVNGQGFNIDLEGEELEKVFAFEDEKSEQVLKHRAEDLAIDDVIYYLDKALERGDVNLTDYLKNIKKFAREQFFHKVDVKRHGFSFILVSNQVTFVKFWFNLID